LDYPRQRGRSSSVRSSEQAYREDIASRILFDRSVKPFSRYPHFMV